MQDICNVFTDKCLKCFRTVREGDPQALIAVGKVVGGDALSRGYTCLGIPTHPDLGGPSPVFNGNDISHNLLVLSPYSDNMGSVCDN